jgi:hypothetical protein
LEPGEREERQRLDHRGPEHPPPAQVAEQAQRAGHLLVLLDQDHRPASEDRYDDHRAEHPRPGPATLPARQRDTGWLFATSGGGGASKSQPRPTIAGRPIYLGERKPAIPTCRDEVVAVVEALVAGGGAPVFTVVNVYAATVSCGSRWPRETVAKTMLRMTSPARRPPYLELERAEPDLYRVVPAREELGRS